MTFLRRAGFWRAAIALLLSLLLHLLVVGASGWHWPEAETPEMVIETRLMALPVPVKNVTPVARPPKAKPAPVVQEAPAPEVAESPTPQAGTDTTDDVPATQDVEAVPQDAIPIAEDQPEVYKPKPPSYVDMDYDLSRGGDSGRIGVVHVLYNKQRDGSYKLRSETKAQGLAALFVSGELIQTSSGMVTEHGLQPAHFAYEFGNNSDKHQYADFDWTAGQLTMHTSKGDKTVPLPGNAQDLLSFMYQYMFVPPLLEMELSVTNGKKLSHYVYTFEGEESVNTGLGDLRSLHIVKKNGESEEKTELWLAIDHHYLPIKIRKTEKDGKSYEQLVTRLSTE